MQVERFAEKLDCVDENDAAEEDKKEACKKECDVEDHCGVPVAL